tara:strand:- start:692 stop:1231 length:540 start_codon:yes stop_codon:yes gene_type:complete
MNDTMGNTEKAPLMGLIANYLREETTTAIYHNPDKLKHVFASQGEKLIRNYFKGNIRSSGESYDVIADDITYEVKSTGGFKASAVSAARNAVGNLNTKKGKCDFIAIVDFAAQRVSVIPNKVFFKRGIIRDAHKGTFPWCSDYTPKRKGTIVENNTKLFKDYEIDAKKEFSKLGMGDKL